MEEHKQDIGNNPKDGAEPFLEEMRRSFQRKVVHCRWRLSRNKVLKRSTISVLGQVFDALQEYYPDGNYNLPQTEASTWSSEQKAEISNVLDGIPKNDSQFLLHFFYNRLRHQTFANFLSPGWVSVEMRHLISQIAEELSFEYNIVRVSDEGIILNCNADCTRTGEFRQRILDKMQEVGWTFPDHLLICHPTDEHVHFVITDFRLD